MRLSIQPADAADSPKKVLLNSVAIKALDYVKDFALLESIQTCSVTQSVF
jgi:hypothetical protein